MYRLHTLQSLTPLARGATFCRCQCQLPSEILTKLFPNISVVAKLFSVRYQQSYTLQIFLQFVMVFGASHLRSVVDGVVEMPRGCLSFGISSTPGASAHTLRQEIQAVHLPRTPDLVCLIAPGNNLTWSRTVEEAGKEFGSLIRSALHRWTRVSRVCTFRIGQFTL